MLILSDEISINSIKLVVDRRIVRDKFFYGSVVTINNIFLCITTQVAIYLYLFSIYIYIYIYNFVLLEISIWNRKRKFYCRIFFWNIISTTLSWLICTFSSKLSTFCMLHVILCFQKDKGIHDPNDPLHFSCMVGFLGCEMCLFQKLYVEGFVDSFATIVFHLFGL